MQNVGIIYNLSTPEYFAVVHEIYTFAQRYVGF